MSKTAFNRADAGRMALEGMESYCATHPNSPSRSRRPALSIRSGLWIALPLKSESLALAPWCKERFAPSTYNTGLDGVSPSEFFTRMIAPVYLSALLARVFKRTAKVDGGKCNFSMTVVEIRPFRERRRP